MLRRTRLSVKPNVKTSVGGRGVTAGTQPLLPVGIQQSSPKGNNEGPLYDNHEQPAAASTSAQSSTEQREHASPERKETTAGISAVSESSNASSALLQRRKRISTAPNLAKPRVSLPSAQQPSVPILKPLPAQHSVVVPPSTKVSTPKEVPKSPKNTLPVSPKLRVPHRVCVGQQSSLPEKRTPIPQVPQFSPFKKSSSKDSNRNVAKDDGILTKGCTSLLKERPSQEDASLEETAGDFNSAPKKTQKSDRERLLKAQKLRELLRQELKKEKKDWKEKHPIIESTIQPDRSRMTMRDFIYYLPDANPMKSAIEREKKSEKPTSIQIQPEEPEKKSANTFEPENEIEEDENDEGPLLVPRVKVAEDGTIILDEESLTVEVLRGKGPVVEENDPIFERGSTTTYSSFRKSNHSKPWSNKETDMFFLAISMVGTDFSMIGQLFPHRERTEIKNKFKREERSNGWRIDKAFKEKKTFDFEFFAKLLKKILAEEAERKKKSVKNKTAPEEKKHKPRTKKGKSAGGNAAKSSTHSEFAENSDTEETDINARIAEKENEESPNVPEGKNVSGSSKKKKKKKKIIDSEKVLINPSEDDIPPDLSVARVKIKKSKSASVNAAKSSMHSEFAENSDTEATDINAKMTEKENEKSPNVPEGQNVSGSSKKKKKKIKIIDSEKVLINPSEDDIHPDLSATQVKIKKKKRNTLEEVDAETGPPTICLEQSKLEYSGRHEDGGMLVDDRPECASSDNERAGEDDDSPSSAENTTNMEEGKPVAITPAPHTRGRVHKPKPNLGKAVVQNVEVEAEHVTGKQAEPAIQHNDGENTILTSASGQSQLELGVMVSEVLPEQDLQTVVNNSPGNQSNTAVDHHRPSTVEENEPQSTRGRFQKLKPNLRQSPGRKERAIVAKVAKNEDATSNEKVVNEEMSHEDSLGSSSSSAIISRKFIFEEEEGFSARKSPRCHNFTKLEPQQQPEDGDESLGSTLECEEQLSSASSPHGFIQNEASVDTCRTGIEDIKTQFMKLPTRGRFQRPKPNLRQAPGRNETSTVAKVSEEEGAISTEDVVIEEGKLDKEDIFSSRKSPRYHNSPKSEQIQQPKDSACSVSLDSPLECAVQPSVFPLSGLVQSETSTDTCRSDPCPISSPEQHKSESPKPTQLRRGRFHKPRPNLGITVGRKITPVAENVTADLSRSDGKKAENSLTENDGHQYNPQPALATSPNKSEQLSPSKHSVNNSFDESKLANLSPCKMSLEQVPPPDQPECKDLANRVITSTLEKAEQEYTSCTSQIPSQEERKQKSLVPAQLVRGRLLRPRPNLGKLTARKDACTSPSMQSNKVETALGSPQRTSGTPALLSTSGAKEVTGSSLCSSLPEEQTSPLLKHSIPENLLECRGQEEQECVLLPSNDNESISNDKTGIDKLDSKNVPQMSSKANAIKPTPLLRGRYQRPKPNVAIATERKEFPAEGKNVGSNKEATDVNTAVTCHAIMDQLAHAQHDLDPNLQVHESVHLFKRKVSVDEPEAVSRVSPKRSRRCSIEASKGPMLCKSDKELLQMSPPSITCSAVTVKTTRQGNKSKLLDSEEPATQSKTYEPPREPEHSEKRKTIPKRKPTTVKGSKNIKGKSAGKKHVVSKRTLVTLRASSQEDDDDDENDDDVDADIDYGEDSDDLAPEEMNKAPVFVPKGLRSPNPVALTIEETMEEFDMSCDTIESQYVTDGSNLPSYLCEVKEANTVLTNENPRMQPGISTPPISTKEEKEIVDGNTEAALTLLAIGDPVFQAKKNMQNAIDDHDEQRNISIDLQKLDCVQPTETESSPSHVPVLPATKDPSTVQSDDRLDVKTDIHSPKETLSSELKIAVSSKPSRSRFVKPKPNLGRAVGIKRSVHQKPLILPVEQASEEQSTEGPPVEEIVTVNSIAQKNDQSKLLANISSGLDELKEDNIEHGQNAERCKRSEDIFKCSIPCETREEGMVTPPEYSSCQSSESGHSLQDTGPFEVSSCTRWEQEEHFGQHQNVTVTCTDQNEVNIDSEEQTFILTLVEIPNVSVDGYCPEDAFSKSEDSLPAPQYVTPTKIEIQCGTQTQSNDNLKAEANKHGYSPFDRPSELLQEFQNPLKRHACVPEENVLPAKKMTPNTIQDVSYENKFGSIEEMPLEPPITPNIVEKRTATLWKSKTSEPIEVKPSFSKSSVTRPARKPLGFLPLLCKKPDSEKDIVMKNNQSSLVPSSVTTTKQGLKRLPSIRKHLDAQTPSTSTASRLNDSRRLRNSTYPPAAAQCEVPAKTQEKKNISSPKTTEPEKEPTGISEYFFGDIFTEVNDSD